MRTPYAVTFMLALLLGGTYWFTHVSAGCNIPISYRIGEIDPRFELTTDEARVALMDAEAIWENATGVNLFRYADDGEYTVNFVFDERQALTEAERELRERLDASENVNAEIDETYAELVAKYNDLDIAYKDKVEAYERRLSAYNDEVRRYNDEGGAPTDAYERLENERTSLAHEQESVNAMAKELNELVADINRLSEEGNELIDLHNRQVEVYNHTFGHEREFTQGEYQDRTINIYTFSDRHELLLVLAHELGHALSVDHVENEASVMYYLMGGQPEAITLSDEDLAAFNAVCAAATPMERYQRAAAEARSFLGFLGK